MSHKQRKLYVAFNSETHERNGQTTQFLCLQMTLESIVLKIQVRK